MLGPLFTSMNDSAVMRAALVHVMMLDDYIEIVKSRIQGLEPGNLRESLEDYLETLQQERLRYYVLGSIPANEQPLPEADDAALDDAA
jgi:hypothetical protein